MAYKNIDELNPMHVDVLTELGNIGTGNAATSLASFMGREVDINVPHVRILGFNEIAEYVGGPENIVMGMLIKIDGDINGMILYVFDNDFIETVMNVFFGKKFSSFDELDEMEKSAFCEIGNIMASSYVNALSSMTDFLLILQFRPSALIWQEQFSASLPLNLQESETRFCLLTIPSASATAKIKLKAI